MLLVTYIAKELEVPFGTMPPLFHEFVNVISESTFGLYCHTFQDFLGLSMKVLALKFLFHGKLKIQKQVRDKMCLQMLE